MGVSAAVIGEFLVEKLENIYFYNAGIPFPRLLPFHERSTTIDFTKMLYHEMFLTFYLLILVKISVRRSNCLDRLAIAYTLLFKLNNYA